MICPECGSPMQVGNVWPYDYTICPNCGNADRDTWQDKRENDGQCETVLHPVFADELPV